MSLRGRLIAVLLALILVGLAGFGITTYAYLRSFLLHRVDQQLLAVQPDAINEAINTLQDANGPPRPGRGFAGGPPDGHQTHLAVPPGTYVELRSPSGTQLGAVVYDYQGAAATRPNLPSGLAPPAGAASTPQTVRSANAAGDYRVLVSSFNNGGAVAIVAVPLRDTESTLSRLLHVEIGVAAAVVLTLAGASLILVRRGLRPLDQIGQTAGAIAAGDLSRRVEPAGSKTEIGRLGTSLNAMLAQIESSFRERRATEDRLRRFLADASHELRTPLTSIQGWAELFRRGARDRPEDLERAMRRIEDEAGHMRILVDEMLSLARLDQSRPLQLTAVELRAMATDAVADAHAVEPGRPISIDSPTDVWVTADRTRLREIFDNLLANVRAHTPAGTPVHIRLAREAGDVSIAVADEGPGMEAAAAGRVFERFWRADQARSGGGAGLGLAIVAGIAQAHGGSVRVDTAPGRGAAFTVTLPADPRPGPGAGPREMGSPRPVAAPPETGGPDPAMMAT